MVAASCYPGLINGNLCLRWEKKKKKWRSQWESDWGTTFQWIIYTSVQFDRTLPLKRNIAEETLSFCLFTYSPAFLLPGKLPNPLARSQEQHFAKNVFFALLKQLKNDFFLHNFSFHNELTDWYIYTCSCSSFCTVEILGFTQFV